MIKVAISGATGFIGVNLVSELRRRDVEVFILPRDIPDIMLEGIDVVINLVGRAHIEDTSHDALKNFRSVNCDYAVDLYRKSSEAGVGKFIHLSSIGVLGNQTISRPFNHKSQLNPVESYAHSKAEAERHLYALYENHAVSLSIIRPPLVYGPNPPGNMGKLFNICGKGIPLPFGRVRNRRDFVSIYNLCDLIYTCIVNDSANGKTLLVSDNQSLSTPELISFISSIYDRKIVQVPVPVGMLRGMSRLLGRNDMMSKLVGNLEIDISYTMDSLGWSPPYTVAESFVKIKQQLIGRNPC